MSDLDAEVGRMDAYYYSFDETGVGAVDAILSAVAQAGKNWHHTDSWTDAHDWSDDTRSDAERIQDAAGACATAIAAHIAAERDALLAKFEALAEDYEATHLVDDPYDVVSVGSVVTSLRAVIKEARA